MGKMGISVEILLYALCNTLSEIAKVDERVRRIIGGWDIEIQFKVQPDGPAAYLQIEKGRVIFYKGEIGKPPLNPLLIKEGKGVVGEISNPDLEITFSSIDSAYSFFLRRSLLPLFPIVIKNLRHPILLFQSLRLLLFAGEYLRPSPSLSLSPMGRGLR